MLIGCCLNLLATADDPIGINRAKMIAEVGFDYVELPMARLMELSEEDFEALCLHLEQIGIPCRSCCNLLPADLKVTGPCVDWDKVRFYLTKAVARAKRLGAKILVFGSPASRNVEGDFPREITMVQFIKALQLMDELADDSISFVIEHVCHKEGNFVYTVAENCLVHEVLRARHVGVLADSYHMAVENEPIENMALAGEHLLHVHTANPDGRVYPAMGDGVDYKNMMDVLKAIDYQGGISVEAFTDNPKVDAAEALKTLRAAME